MTPSATLLVALLFASGLNAAVGTPRSHKTPNPCVLCQESPCQCDQLALEDDHNQKRSIKRFILLLLGRIGASSPTDTPERTCSACQDCRWCRPPRRNLFKVLATILQNSTACSRENEDEVLRDLILKLIDPTACERHPCEPYCDPQVQKVLRAILKKASTCNFPNCPCECALEHLPSDRGEYRYWFRTTKDSIRREIPHRPANRAQNPDQVLPSPTEKRLPPRKQTCSTCRKPDKLVCPRYMTGDCPATGNEAPYSICADCSVCKMAAGDYKNQSAVALVCQECRPIDSPFVTFTPTGWATRETTPARSGALRIRTNFLQTNDFRSDGAGETTCSNNPFQMKCNRPIKRRKRCQRP